MSQDDHVFRRGANAVVVSPSGRLLVLTCSEWPERPHRSLKPDLVGGCVEPGETIIQGMVREVYEESGLRLHEDSIRLFFQNTNRSIFEPGYWHNHYFVARSLDDNVKLSWEHTSHYWTDIEGFLSTNWRPSQREAVDFMDNSGLLRYYVNFQ